MATKRQRRSRAWWQPICHWLCGQISAEAQWLDHQLLPPHCHACHRPISSPLNPLHGNGSTSLCSDCFTAALRQPVDNCPICAEPYLVTSSVQHLCGQCSTTPAPFIWLQTAGLYTDQLGELIQQFKYQHKPQLAVPLGELMVRALGEQIQNYAPTQIIPVPLHPQRLKERGFNQSLLLARRLAQTLDLPLLPTALERHRYTPPQSQLSARQRHLNIAGAFHSTLNLPPQRLLLVDDVVTTTATARACTIQLQKHGHTVAVVAAARAIGHT
ncbi:MAG: ComF family protein [Desulfuromonas sp.]|nr:ComF family protein [Desulfuromonas sp.]